MDRGPLAFNNLAVRDLAFLETLGLPDIEIFLASLWMFVLKGSCFFSPASVWLVGFCMLRAVFDGDKQRKHVVLSSSSEADASTIPSGFFAAGLTQTPHPRSEFRANVILKGLVGRIL